MSGSLIGGVVGAVVGYFVSGFNPMGAVYGWEVGSIAGAILMPGSLPDGPRLADLNPQASVYGRPLPIVYGTMGVSGNVIWASQLIETKHESGGKGSPSQSTYTYSANFAIALCEGVQTLGRIWAGPERRLIWDGSKLESGQMRFYPGDELQLPDPLIESYLGAAFTPAYRGTAYIVFENFQLANDFNTIPVILAEVGAVAAAGAAPPAPYAIAPGTWSAIDPTTGYVWAIANLSGTTVVNGKTYSAGSHLTVIDPAGETIIAHAGPPSVSWPDTTWTGVNDTPKEICFDPVTGGFYIGNDGATINAANPFGWHAQLTAGTSIAVANPAGFAIAAIAPVATIHTGGVQVTAANIYLFSSTTGNTDPGGNWITAWKYNNPGPVPSSSYPDVSNPNPLGTFNYHTKTDMADDASFMVLQNNDKSIQCFDPALPGISFTQNNINPTAGVPTLLLAWSPFDNAFYAYKYDTAQLYLITKTSVTALVQFPQFSVSLGSNQNYLGATLPATNLFPEAMAYDNSRNTLWISTTDFGGVGNLYEINTLSFSGLNFTIANTILNNGPIGGGYAGKMLSRVPNYNKLVGWDYKGLVYIIPFGNPASTLSPKGIALSAIVSDISVRAGLTTGQIDVTQLTDIVDGYSVTRQMDCRAAIDALRPIYFFDGVESSGKIKFVKRGANTGVVVVDSDLAAHPHGQGVPDPLLTVRQMEVELPKFIDVKYQLAATNYQPAAKQAKRLTGFSQNITTIDIPLVLADRKAQDVAETNLYVSWTQRLSYQFSLPKKYCYLEPTDYITVKGHGMRIEKVTMTPDGILNMEAIQDDPNIYTMRSAAVAVGQISQTVYFPPATAILLLDVNMMQDSDNNAGFYAAACGAQGSSGWKGCTLYASTDSGSNYTVIATLPVAATIGVVANVIGNFTGGDIPDEINSITVNLYNGTLSSTTYSGLINGTLSILCGNELMNYQNATLNMDGSYTLTGLLRGRRGTENYMSKHVAGEKFLFIDPKAVIRVLNQPADIGISKLYKAVTNQATLGTTAAQNFINYAHGLWPYAPTLLGGGKDASNNWTLTWTRRSRISGAWRDLVDVPLGEETEQYTVTIWDSAYTTLKRTIRNITSASTVYTAAQQTTDFGGTQSTIYFQVDQVSAIVGDGYISRGTAPESTTTFI